MELCPYCSTQTKRVYHEGLCPEIKTIEYNLDGTIRRIEFMPKHWHADTVRHYDVTG